MKTSSHVSGRRAGGGEVYERARPKPGSARPPVRATRLLLIPLLIASLSACAPLLQLTRSPERAPAVVKQRHPSTEAQMVALMRYVNSVAGEKPLDVRREQSEAAVAFERHPTPFNRLRLALSLSVDPLTESGLKRARHLLLQYVRNKRPSSEDGQLMPLALFLLSNIRRQESLLAALDSSQAAQASLKHKLQALTEVEQKMNHMNRSAPGR